MPDFVTLPSNTPRRADARVLLPKFAAGTFVAKLQLRGRVLADQMIKSWWVSHAALTARISPPSAERAKPDKR